MHISTITTLKFLSVLLFSTALTLMAGVSASSDAHSSIIIQDNSIDLIFASDFETSITTTLVSEQPFNDTLPALETGHAQVGLTPTSFSVDQTGQANYTIPIFAGAGTAGVAPQVALQYSSAANNGAVGVGWSISGISVISRCRETAESKDTSATITPQPITYGSADKFCLNGERLYATEGIYGDDATEYRTEKDQFARITSFAGKNNNPDYFTVERKDGSISYYGNTVDSNITVTSDDVSIDGVTYTWALNRYQDTLSNYIDYAYNTLPNSEFVLTDIDYTGNLNESLTPYSNIHFVYETRSDTFTAYLGGVAFATTQRLAMIESSIDGILVRDYTLDYATSSSARSILTSVQECRASTCLPAVSFTWSQPDISFKTSTSTNSNFPKNIKSSKLGDINGDARADLVFVDENSNRFKIAYAGGHGGFTLNTATTINSPSGDKIDNKWHLVDYNADGKQDLMLQSTGIDKKWLIYLAQASGFASTSIPTGISAVANSDFKIVDVNGDGLADLLYPATAQGSLSVRYLQATAGGYGFANAVITLDLPNNYAQIPGIATPPTGFSYLVYEYYHGDDINFYTHDVNGDGVTDLILKTNVMTTQLPNDETQAYYFRSAGQALTSLRGEPTDTVVSSQWVAFIGKGINSSGKLDYKTENHFIQAASINGGGDNQIKFLDINADGLMDVVNRISLNNWEFRLATGTGFTDKHPLNNLNNEEHLQFFDYNLDGYVDLVYPSNALNNRYLWRKFNGNGFNAPLFITANAVNVNQNVNLFMDFDGDGAVDHLRIDNTGKQKLYPRTDVYQSVDQITTFSNSLGAKTQVLYRPLTFSDTYHQGNYQTHNLNYGQGSPVLDVMAALYVVKQVDTDAPIENDENATNSSRYSYENARIQTGGRGFLGFEKVITATAVKAQADVKAKILTSITTYRQDFPYNGIPINTEVRQLDDNFDDSQAPICQNDDSCFPEPCFPGTTCTSLPRAGSSTLLSQITNTVKSLNPSSKSVFPYIETTSLQTYSPETGELLKTETQNTSHDSFGNPLLHTVTIKDASGTILQTNITTNTYSNITTIGRWLIGLLETSTTVKTRTGQPSISTTSEFDYDYATGLLLEERQDPTGGDELFLRTRYQYDAFGNTQKVITCSGEDLTATACDDDTDPQSSNSTSPYHIHRYQRTTFDAKGRYVDATYNTQEQKLSDVLSRDIYGNPLTSIDVLGQTTTSSYDVMGRLTSTRNSLGTWSQTSRVWCAGLMGILACPTGMQLAFRVRKMDAGGTTSYIYMDALAREVATISRTFNASDDAATLEDERYVVNKIWHDQFGRKLKSVGDHFLGASASNIPITITEFDRYNRSSKITLPDNSNEHMSYAGFTTHFTNDKGQRREESNNALGQLIEVKDFDIQGANPEYKNSMTYTYDSQGGLLQVSRDANKVINLLIDNSYDRRGRKIAADDVDTGFSEIFYNALGEVVETIDSEDNSIKTYYDNLGRAYQVESWNGNTQLTRNTNTYNATNGLLLTEAKLTIAGNISYTQTHVYDGFKRPQTTNISFTNTDNVCAGTLCTYQANLYYDQFSRLKYQQDVSGKAIENHYNAQGYLFRVTDATDGNKQYYRINTTDKWGNVLSETKAGTLNSTYTFDPNRGWLNSINSTNQSYFYQYDSLGNLDKRGDIFNDLSECFVYDRLNRLTDTYRYNNFAQDCSLTTGNIDQQISTYDAKGNLINKDGLSYAYLLGSDTSIGTSPHQVQSKGSQVFSYDDRGNLTKSTNFKNAQNQSVDRNISYTGFNKIQRIYTGSNPNNPIAQSIYRYNNSEDRYSRTDRNSDNETTVTHFMGSVEVEYNHNGQIAFKRHLGNFAVITETNNSTQETYLFHDHLGSIDVITDKQGKPLQHMSFSAWGERRLPANWNTMPLPSIRDYLSDYTTKGFTGHEMLDAFGIINMGGRIYDAALGKMLQADPVVQDPNTSQSFNRYSYVHNNPLSFTDPTGYFSLRQLVGVVVGIALSYILPGIGFSVFWTAFSVGFSSTFIITGNLKASLRAGIVAGALAFVGNQFANTGTADAASTTTAGGEGDITTGTATTNNAAGTNSASHFAGVSKAMIATDVTLQIVQSLDPKIGAILGFINGKNINFANAETTGATMHNLISHYGKFKATEELERFARKNGLSLVELNLALVTISFAGNKLVGTRFEADNYNGETGAQGIHGMFDRQSFNAPIIDPTSNKTLNRIIGSPFDVVDVILGYTGILTASDYDFIRKGTINQTLNGHSLGTLGVSNLVARGYLDAGLAHLDSLPFGNVVPAGIELDIGTIDPVNGFFFGKILNPSANLVSGCIHPITCYHNPNDR